MRPDKDDGGNQKLDDRAGHALPLLVRAIQDFRAAKIFLSPVQEHQHTGGPEFVKVTRPAQARISGAAFHQILGLWKADDATQAPARPAGGRRPSRVLASRQAMVIGPTPPGTGVIAPACGSASA